MQLLARMRGAFVGLMSGAVAIAGHGLGGGAMALSESSLLLLVLVCAAAGAAVTPGQVQSNRLLVLLAVLGLGQVMGHVILTLSHGHAHGLMPAPSMVAGHLTVLVLTAVLIRCAERGLIAAFGFVARLLTRALDVAAGLVPLWTATITGYRPAACRFVALSTAGTRGPPLPA
ncbi:MAG: hypothetical protein C0482_26130 [Gordonia sp.]|nr:hypothetical protein [Gordonia sp. (in: high G+C Gram-positive bacteria)]